MLVCEQCQNACIPLSLWAWVGMKVYHCQEQPPTLQHSGTKGRVDTKTSDGPSCRVLNVTETKCQEVEQVMIKVSMWQWETRAWAISIFSGPHHHTVLHENKHKRHILVLQISIKDLIGVRQRKEKEKYQLTKHTHPLRGLFCSKSLIKQMG